jgi:hypothetical protein
MPSGAQLTMSPYDTYSNLGEDYLNKYGRTMIGKKGFKSLTFENIDRKKSFLTFEECLSYYVSQVVRDGGSTVNLPAVFKMTTEDGSPMSSNDYFLNYLELKIVNAIENSFRCAGMCQVGLFYYKSPTYLGAPKDTCLL